MYSPELNMWSKRKYTKKDFLKRLESFKYNYIKLELIMNKYNLGIGKRQLYIRNNNQIDPANSVYNCRNLRFLIFSYFGENYFGDMRYIFDLDRSKEFNIILNKNRNIIFENNINSLYMGFFKRIYNEYNITKIPLYNILNIGNKNLYMKIIYKLTRGPFFTISSLKKFLKKYNIYCKSGSQKYYYVEKLLNILIKNFSKDSRDDELNLEMVIDIFEDNSKIFLNFDYVVDYRTFF